MIHRYKIMQKLVDLVLPGHTIIYPPYEPGEINLDMRLVAYGSGPERAAGGTSDNPNWHRNRAANEIAVAKWLEANGGK